MPLATKRIVKNVEVCAICKQPLEDGDVEAAVLGPVDGPMTNEWWSVECEDCAFGVR